MVSAKTQWRIFGVALLAVLIFILVYIGINHFNGFIFILPAPQQPLALLLAALIVAPLVLPFILPYIRLTSVKAFGIEIALDDVRVPVSDAEGAVSGEDLTAIAIKETLNRAMRSKIVRIHFGKEQSWSSRVLFLLVALLKEFTETQLLVFTEDTPNAGVQVVGWATPTTVLNFLDSSYSEVAVHYQHFYGWHSKELVNLVSQSKQSFMDDIVDRLVKDFVIKYNQQKELVEVSRLRGDDRLTMIELDDKQKRAIVQDVLTTSLLTSLMSKAKSQIDAESQIDATRRENADRFLAFIDRMGPEGEELVVVDLLKLAVYVANDALSGKKASVRS